MSRPQTKKGVAKKGEAKKTEECRKKPQKKPAEACRNCAKSLLSDDRALFVEEEVGRIFCSEGCIAGFFNPEIERLEKEYFRRLSPSDLTPEERENLAHLRWITLQEPDEVWREKTLSGDYRYTLISEFKPSAKPVWSICICLFLQGEPSFLYLAFTTQNAAMMAAYRRGERVPFSPPKNRAQSGPTEEEGPEPTPLTDGLADAWTEDETLRAQLIQERSHDDIPSDEFSLYQACLEETLESPDEVWSLNTGENEAHKLYHFIRHYPDEKPGVWYLIVAKDTDDETQIEILDAFPTRDSSLVDRYRRGEQEVGHGADPTRSAQRVIH